MPARAAGGARAFAGRLDEGERLAEEAVELNRRHGDDADQEYTVQRLALALLRRRPQDAPLAALRDYAARYPALPVWQAMLARAEWRLRRRRRRARSVAACARDGFAAVAAHAGLALRASPCSPSRSPALGDPEQVEQLVARARSARRPQRGDGRRLGGVRAGRAPARRARGRRAAGATRRSRSFARRGRARRRAGDAPGWELAALADWLARRAGARATASASAGWRSRATLELPGLATAIGAVSG